MRTQLPIHRLASFLAALVAALTAACGTPPASLDPGLDGEGVPLVQTQVFWTPNVGGLDYLDLFRKPESWASARSKISVFKFYEAHLRGPNHAVCQATNGVNLDSLTSVDAFNKLKSWGIAIGVEVGGIKDWDCTGMQAARANRDMLRRLSRVGVDINYLAFDEPLYSGVEHCGLSVNETARRLADHIRHVREEFPAVQFGSMDAYPHFSAAHITTWLSAVESALGQPIDFEHLDVDFNYVRNAHANLNADLPALRDYCDSRGVGFGPMTTANEWGSPGDHAGQNRFFYDTVMSEVRDVKRAMSAPSQIVLPSWFSTCTGSISNPCDGNQCLTVPDNLPESGAHTFTRLLNDALAAYGFTSPPPPAAPTDDARIIGDALPSQMTAGTTAPVSVTVRNTGTTTWTRATHRLGSPGGSDPFAPARIYLPADTTVPPGASITFRFEFRAPNTVGNHATDWRMVHEQVRWFGDTLTRSVSVTATGGANPGEPPPPVETPPPEETPPGDSETSSGNDRLLSNERLESGESLVSNNGRFRLRYQGDGNLVLSEGSDVLWASYSNGHTPGATVMQSDGNLVVRDAANVAQWFSGTHGHPGAWLVVQDDGNLVIYDAANVPLWATLTQR